MCEALCFVLDSSCYRPGWHGTLYKPGWSQTHHLPTLASRVLGLGCDTPPHPALSDFKNKTVTSKCLCVPQVPKDLLVKIKNTILQRTVDGMQQEGVPYTGKQAAQNVFTAPVCLGWNALSLSTALITVQC